MNLLDKFHFKDKNGIQTTMEICDSFSRSKIAEVVGMIPTKVSQLLNDSGFITSADVPTKTSELQNDSGFITSADVPTKTSQLQNDSGFTTFDGDYNSLSNKPTIPAVTNTSRASGNWVYFKEHNLNGDKLYAGSYSITSNINNSFGSLYYSEVSVTLPVNITPNNIVVSWFGDILVDVNIKSVAGNVITLWLTCPIVYNASGHIQFNIE